MIQEAGITGLSALRIVGLAALVAAQILSGTSTCLASDDRAPLSVTPSWIDVGDMANGSQRELEFVVSNSSDTDVRLIFIYAECDCSLQVPEGGIVPAHGEYILQAVLTIEGLDKGPFDELITILIDHPRQRELNIPITAFVD